MRPLVVIALAVALVGCGSSSETEQPTGADATPAPSSSYVWAQDCGVTAHEHAPHNPSLAADPAYDAEDYRGLSLREARAKAAAEGLVVRLLGVDGACEGRTADLKWDRVNLYVADGAVAAAARY